MSKGTAVTAFKDHTTINLSFLPVLTIAVYFQYGIETSMFLTIGFVFSTFLLNPDIDSSESVTYKNWFIFRGYWYPYTKWMSHKGSSHNIISDAQRGWGHNEFVGTGLRLLLASPLLTLNIWLKMNVTQWLIIVAGIWIADCLHIIVDLFFHKN